MNLTTFKFFKDTPLIDFQNTIHFKSNSERDTFFLEGGHYSELEIGDVNFNYIRDKSTIKLNVSYDAMRGVNYCTFKSDFEDVRYYAYVIEYRYLNDHAVEVDLLIDSIMTFTQGSVLNGLTNINVQREHLPQAMYNANLWELKNNDDIIKTNTKNYFHTDRVLFNDLLVVITSSADLEGDFGTRDDPHVQTSYGQRFDKITSPLNLYACDMDDFNKLMGQLSRYAWIAQNIRSLILIPRIFMQDNLTVINFSEDDSLSGVDYLYKVSGINTSKTSLIQELQNISYNMLETYELFDLDPVNDRHLLRNEYTTTELYNYSGGQLFIDNGQLNEFYGLSYQVDIITGYHNEMKVYVDQYRANENLHFKGGSYLNDSLTFNQFDDIPMMIDSFDLAMSKNANQRELAESKLLTNRVQNVMDPNANLQDRFMNAASLVSNLSPSNLFGKFSDEYEYYRTQKAEQADMALETPSISQQTTGNSFNIANDMFGIHIKYSKPTATEMNKIRKYYKLFGYQINDQSGVLNVIDSMSICNFVQFSGSWTIPNVDVALIEMMKAQFENGVRLWHNNDTPNPMKQDILDNVMVG